MRVVYMGTAQLACPILEALDAHHEVVGVFTRPDAVRGRGKKLIASPVKETALELGIDVYTPKSMKGDDAIELVASLRPDVICVASYGCILPKEMLDIPPYGCLNVHTSLLPRWRGAAPIERAILEGDEQTGVCIMRMDEGLDTGPYCICRSIEIDGIYIEELNARLADLGAAALLVAIEQSEAGVIKWIDQGEEGLTYAEKVRKEELVCDPCDTVAQIDAKVRVASESRPARAQVAGRGIAIERVAAVREGELPGELPGQGEAALVAKRLVVGAADGALELVRVKPDGKKSMDGRAFAAGIQGIKGTRVKWERA